MSSLVVVESPTPRKHDKCQHFGLTFDLHDMCRKCTIRERGSLHTIKNMCIVCSGWSTEHWSRYSSPLEAAIGLTSSVDGSVKAKPKAKKGRGKSRTSTHGTTQVGVGEATASVVPCTTVSNVPTGSGKRPKASETVAKAVVTAGMTYGSAVGVTRGSLAATGSGVVTTAVGPVSTVTSLPKVFPPMVQPGDCVTPWLLPSASGTTGILPGVYSTLPDLTGTPQFPVISTRESLGSLGTASVPVTTVSSMGSRQLPSVGTVDSGSNQNLPYMVQLMQQMLQGFQGPPQLGSPQLTGVPVMGYTAMPTVSSTANGPMVGMHPLWVHIQ